MKIKALLPFFSILLLSCGEQVVSQQSAFSQTNTFAALPNQLRISDDIDLRLSLISPPASRQVLHLLGATEPYLIGLTTLDHVTSKDGKFYTEAGKFLALKVGVYIGDISNYQAELLDYNTKTRVGTLKYVSRTDYPNNPYQIIELCTGRFENACILSFDSEAKQYRMKINEAGNISTPPQKCTP